MDEALARTHVSDAQCKQICEIIRRQLMRYSEKSAKLQSIMLEEYKPHRASNARNLAIYSGFPSGSNVVDGFRIDNLKYGQGHHQPLLTNENTVVLLLPSTSDKAAQYLKEYYELNQSEGIKKLFFYVLYTINDKNELKTIKLICPKGVNENLYSRNLFESSNLVLQNVG